MQDDHPIENLQRITRRHFFGHSAAGIGSVALGALLSESLATPAKAAATSTRTASPLQFPPRAKRVIYLFQAGGPAQQDLFDYKPLLNQKNGQQLPAFVRGGQRLTGMSAQQASIPMAGSIFKFAQHGQSGAWLSEILPHHRQIVDDVCFVKSMFTEAINHDPAVTFFQTGSQIAGRPSMGSWLSYGLGTMNADLPSFIVLVSANQGGQPLYARLWGSGFLDSKYQGVQLRPGKDPVLYLSNPDGICRSGRGAMLDKLNTLNRHQFEQELDPEIESRIAQYEMAFRMQTSVPVSHRSVGRARLHVQAVRPRLPPTRHVRRQLPARSPIGRTRRAIHSTLSPRLGPPLRTTRRHSHASAPKPIERQPPWSSISNNAACLDDTLVVWGGEFGRTSYSQGTLTATDYGRDHHPRCFTVWLAGGGIKPGLTYGRTDDYGYNIADSSGHPISPTKDDFTPGAVHVHDLQATILYLLGIDHTQLTFKYEGRRFRLTDVHGHVVHDILA